MHLKNTKNWNNQRELIIIFYLKKEAFFITIPTIFSIFATSICRYFWLHALHLSISFTILQLISYLKETNLFGCIFSSHLSLLEKKNYLVLVAAYLLSVHQGNASGFSSKIQDSGFHKLKEFSSCLGLLRHGSSLWTSTYPWTILAMELINK